MQTPIRFSNLEDIHNILDQLQKETEDFNNWEQLLRVSDNETYVSPKTDLSPNDVYPKNILLAEMLVKYYKHRDSDLTRLISLNAIKECIFFNDSNQTITVEALRMNNTCSYGDITQGSSFNIAYQSLLLTLILNAEYLEHSQKTHFYKAFFQNLDSFEKKVCRSVEKHIQVVDVFYEKINRAALIFVLLRFTILIPGIILYLHYSLSQINNQQFSSRKEKLKECFFKGRDMFMYTGLYLGCTSRAFQEFVRPYFKALSEVTGTENVDIFGHHDIKVYLEKNKLWAVQQKEFISFFKPNDNESIEKELSTRSDFTL